MNRRKVEYLIGFKGYPDSHNEWQVFDPNNSLSWFAEWDILQQFDPSVGSKPKSPAAPSSLVMPRRSNSTPKPPVDPSRPVMPRRSKRLLRPSQGKPRSQAKRVLLRY